ncbi:MAG: hypothetical protein KAS32_03035 [Candidatus Peribacteraceae bacterium]|nr:hypothetical protein [Candidatus Peribacteraceae bacterium]
MEFKKIKVKAEITIAVAESEHADQALLLATELALNSHILKITPDPIGMPSFQMSAYIRIHLDGSIDW